jgi:hypothetical protein
MGECFNLINDSNLSTTIKNNLIHGLNKIGESIQRVNIIQLKNFPLKYAKNINEWNKLNEPFIQTNLSFVKNIEDYIKIIIYYLVCLGYDDIITKKIEILQISNDKKISLLNFCNQLEDFQIIYKESPFMELKVMTNFLFGNQSFSFRICNILRLLHHAVILDGNLFINTDELSVKFEEGFLLQYDLTNNDNLFFQSNGLPKIYLDILNFTSIDPFDSFFF